MDESGRNLVFHGVNAVYKVFPFYPIYSHFHSNNSLSDLDFKNLKSWGMNFIRFYVAWEGVEPQRGNYNFTYLKEL